MTRVPLRVLVRDVSVALDDPVRISIRIHLRVNIISMHEMPENRLLKTAYSGEGEHLFRTNVNTRILQRIT